MKECGVREAFPPYQELPGCAVVGCRAHSWSPAGFTLTSHCPKITASSPCGKQVVLRHFPSLVQKSNSRTVVFISSPTPPRCVSHLEHQSNTHRMPAVLLVELSPSLLPQGRAQEPKATLSNENKPLTFPRHTSQQLISPSALDCFKLYLFKTYKYKTGQ